MLIDSEPAVYLSKLVCRIAQAIGPLRFFFSGCTVRFRFLSEALEFLMGDEGLATRRCGQCVYGNGPPILSVTCERRGRPALNFSGGEGSVPVPDK